MERRTPREVIEELKKRAKGKKGVGVVVRLTRYTDVDMRPHFIINDMGQVVIYAGICGSMESVGKVEGLIKEIEGVMEGAEESEVLIGDLAGTNVTVERDRYAKGCIRRPIKAIWPPGGKIGESVVIEV